MMHRLLVLLRAAPVAAFTLLPVAAMNNADLLQMKGAGLSDDTILLAIANEPPDYDTSPAALVELKKAGVSEPIIQKLLALKNGKASGTRAPTGEAAADEVASPAPLTPAGPAVASAVFAQEFPSIAPPFVEPVVGQTYFTRYNLHEERGKSPTTNYTRGTLVPLNTAVKLLAMKKDELLLQRLDSGEELKIENVEKYSRKSLGEVARLLLSAEKTPLEKLPPEVAGAIRSGEMRKGMTKELVLMTRGYPPGHETPTIEGDRWVYWTSRFVKHTLVFGNDRLVEGRGLY